ncbi:bifunctional metallophosphatase/5'-nucleotidase [Deinococcus sp.]|uniref:bifunctional metallophosphatase/5'-nucleotidase n=1 Tax=Deinococcus sp. TaxID=47478 RepID=UPI0025EACA6C|nr:bifunctional metallophosphatase/5'-nucleotidase [Deinococcus sp.]
MHGPTKTAIWMLGLTLTLSACTPTMTNRAPQPVNVTVLGLNDFHGNLLPTGFSGVKVPDPKDATKTVNLSTGGAEIIGGYVDSVRAANPNTVFVGGGDLIGASPVISSLLRDEPSVDALSAIGMHASALGNHEFDQGLSELLRMQNGGCASNAPDKACKFEAAYAGAKFKWLGANVEDKTTGKNPFQPYYIEEIGGARVAFVGAVTKTTPGIVSPSGVATLNFLDEADSANKYVPELKKLNVDAIILLIHEGGEAKNPDGTADLAAYMKGGCMNLSGAIVDITKRLDPAFNAVISGHSHKGYNCLVGTTPVIQGDFYGHLLQRLDLSVDKANHKLLSIKAENVLMDASATTKLPKSAAMTALVAKAKGLTDAVSKTVVGKLSAAQISRGNNDAGESALGDVIADSQLAAASAAAQGSAVIALMNPGGIRADLLASAEGNSVTFGDAFAVQPFGNTLTVVTLTGAQLKTVLEQQWQGQPGGPRLLQISRGLTYTYDLSQPDGSKVVAGSLKLGGVAIDPAAKYRVVDNSFLADGGDAFAEFKNGTDRLSQPNLGDVDAFIAYLKANSPVSGGAQDRIVKK